MTNPLPKDPDYAFPRWQLHAIRELITVLANIDDGEYISPQDLGDEIKSLGEGIALSMDPRVTEDPAVLPNLLDAVGSHAFSLRLASQRLAALTGKGSAEELHQLHLTGWAQYQMAKPELVGEVVQQAIATIQAFSKQSNAEIN